MNIKKIFSSLNIIILLLLFFNCTAKTENNKEVRISVPKSLSSIPVSILNKKIVNDTSITISYFQDHIMTMADFITGNIDILMTGYSQGAAVAETNNEIVHLATLVWGVSSLVTFDENIRQLEDLSGKTISVPFQNSPLDLQIKAILKKAQLSDAIRIEYNPIQQATALLIQKKITAAAVPEPLATIIVHQKGLYSLFTLPDKWEDLFGYKNTPQVSLFVKKSFIKKNKKFIDSFLKALEENILSIPALTNEQKTHYATEMDIPINLMDNAISHTIFALFSSKQEINTINTYMTDIEIYNKMNKDFFYSHD